MKKQHVKISGKVRIVHKDANGKLVADVTHENDIVDAGLAFLAARAIGTPTVMSHIALGDGTTAVAPADTTLDNELDRAAFSTPAVSLGNVITFEASFGPGAATGAVTEAGILNAAAAGTLLNRLVFPVVNKGALDTVEVEWVVTFEDDGV